MQFGDLRKRRCVIGWQIFTLRAEVRPLQRVQMRQAAILKHSLKTFGGGIEFISQQRYERRRSVSNELERSLKLLARGQIGGYYAAFQRLALARDFGTRPPQQIALVANNSSL